MHKITFEILALFIAVIALPATNYAQATRKVEPSDIEKAVMAKLNEIQNAAQGLDADRLFTFVLENDKGALIQNGRLLLTRTDALEATRQGFRGLKKVNYEFSQQYFTLISPVAALVTGEGSATAITDDGRTFTRPFAQ